MKKLEYLALIRNSKALTQKQMAELLGVSLSMYEKVEGGRIPPSRNFIAKFKKNFPNKSVDKIFFDIK